MSKKSLLDIEKSSKSLRELWEYKEMLEASKAKAEEEQKKLLKEINDKADEAKKQISDSRSEAETSILETMGYGALRGAASVAGVALFQFALDSLAGYFSGGSGSRSPHLKGFNGSSRSTGGGGFVLEGGYSSGTGYGVDREYNDSKQLYKENKRIHEEKKKLLKEYGYIK